MKTYFKWGALAVLALAVLIPVAIYLVSEAQISRHYTLPSSILHARPTAKAVARGKHLATIFGCAACHGEDMRGRMLDEGHGFRIEATDLTAFAKRASDQDFDRAVRRGLSPRARALWAMPVDSYVYMRTKDLAAIVAYIRSLPADDKPVHEPSFGLTARLAVLECKLAPASPYALGRNTPLDAGPHWSGGRYLAAISCSQCHGTDLAGTESAPDLKIAASYSRAGFFHLLHGGPEKNGKRTDMSAVGGTRFSAMHDYETSALYDYLVERARLLKTLPPQSNVTKKPCPPARKPPPN